MKSTTIRYEGSEFVITQFSDAEIQTEIQAERRRLLKYPDFKHDPDAVSPN